MKKILTLAALMAIAAMRVTAASAATMAAAAAPKIDAVCYILPLLPKCVDEWKAAHPMAPVVAPVKKVAAVTTKAAVKATTTTMNMMMMPKCTPAPAGSAYLYVCK
jgi:hypothetical protein